MQSTNNPIRPTVVCLCGSTMFLQQFREANFQETLAGRIVLSVGCDTQSDGWLQLTPAQKYRLDALHMCKIDMADEVLVLNVGGYIGESTAREIAYARLRGKKVRYLEGVSFPLFELPTKQEVEDACLSRPAGPRPAEYAGE